MPQLPFNTKPSVVHLPRAHALCSPSSADRWIPCPGSVAMELDEPDTTSDAAEEGTQAHGYAAEWLVTGKKPDMPDDMVAPVLAYVTFVLNTIADAQKVGGTVNMLVERKLTIEGVTGERGATGTADVVLIIHYPDASVHLHVIDLKFGRGVEVDDETMQLPIYGLAGIDQYGLMDDFTHVLTTIVQPRLRREFHTSEYEVAELEALRPMIAQQAALALQIVEDGITTALAHLKVTEKGCRFCKAKHKCPAQGMMVHETVYGELQDIEDPSVQAIAEDTFTGPKTDFEKLLPLFMKRVPEIEAWCKYVRAKVEQLLVAGKPVPGFKLVQGRMGARKWADQDGVYMVLRTNNVPREVVMTLPELRSPADLEKKLKPEYPQVWQALGTLITQAPGSPSVAPESDPRPNYAGAVFDGDSYDAKDLV